MERQASAHDRGHKGLTVLGKGDEAPYRPMIEVELGIEELQAEWLHCDCIANFVANMISHNRSDSVRHANLFSSALNELLELAFRAPRLPEGRMVCSVLRQGPVERVALTFPATDSDAAFYDKAVGAAGEPDAEERYLTALARRSEPAHQKLTSLVLECNARVSVTRADAHSITLWVDLPLEGLVS